MTIPKISTDNSGSSPEKRFTTPKSAKTKYQRISRLLRLNSTEDQAIFSANNTRNVSKSSSPGPFGIIEDYPKKQLFQSSMPDVSFRSTKIPISWEFGTETEVHLPPTPEATDLNATVTLRRAAKKTVRYSKSVFEGDGAQDAVEVFPKCRLDDEQSIGEPEDLDESKNHDLLEDSRNSATDSFNRIMISRFLNRPIDNNVVPNFPRRESNWSGYHANVATGDDDEEGCDLRCPVWLDGFVRSPKYILLLIAVVLMIFGTVLLSMPGKKKDDNSLSGLREINYRLPRDLDPKVYEIDLVPKFWEGVFHGQVMQKID